MSFPSADVLMRYLPQATNVQEKATGGFKRVYKGTVQGVDEALKLIHLPSCKSDEEQITQKELILRINREYNILKSCTVNEIVKVGQIDLQEIEIEGQKYMLYSEEYVEGNDLGIIINGKLPRPSEDDLKKLFCALLIATEELWEKHATVHRDIKPKNIIKTSNPQRPYVLVDYGIAYAVEETALTFNPGQRVMATYRYLAPELANPIGRATIDYRTDIYAIGLTVFEYATNQHPLFLQPNASIIDTFYHAVNTRAIPLGSLRQDLPQDFCEIIDQCLKKKAVLRPSNIRNLIETFGN